MAESLELGRRLNDRVLVNRSQLGLLQFLVALGELESVPALCAEARELSRALGDHWAEHFADHFLADCALMQGDYATAAAHYALSLQAAVRSGDRIETCFELQGVAMASAGLGQAERALRIAGAALGAEAETAWQAGRRMGFEAAIAEAAAS